MKTFLNKRRGYTWLALSAPVLLAAPLTAHAINGCTDITVGDGHFEGASLDGGVLYKNFRATSAGPLYSRARLGTEPSTLLTAITNAVDHLVSWKDNTSPPPTIVPNPVQFESVIASNQLKSTVAGIATDVKTISKMLTSLNYVEIAGANTTTAAPSSSCEGQSIILENVIINGCLIDFDPGQVGVQGLTWPRCNSAFTKHVRGLDLLAGGNFVITANIKREGSTADSANVENTSTPGAEIVRWVQVSVGYYAPPDDEGPLTTSVTVPGPVYLNGQATVNATVDDTTTGSSNIASAEYKLNDGAWTAMTAVDTLDSPEENFTATFTADVLGENEVCVRGTDVIGNQGPETCENFVVTYVFRGFFEPINEDAETVAQRVKAGRTIPVKWHLTDANGVPISDPTSFAGLYSTPIDCDGTDAGSEVSEGDAGNSGLQYNGDGYWQYNWKTLKSYANTCRGMYVRFNSTAVSPTAIFSFSK